MLADRQTHKAVDALITIPLMHFDKSYQSDIASVPFPPFYDP